jgi:DNA-binding Lrp family transcriptional regulator
VSDSPGRAIDEFDISLLDALHVNPRSSYEQLAAALDVAAGTVARRWRRMTDAGTAWVSSVPGPHVAMFGAVFEARAVAGHIDHVAHKLAASPNVASVYVTTGGFDLVALVLADQLDTLNRLLLDDLPRLPQIEQARSSIGIDWYSGARWRLGAISRQQANAVRLDSDGGRPIAARTQALSAQDRALYLALQYDGRAGYRDLARGLDSSEYQVRRRISALERRGMLTFRTDFARGPGGWAIQLALWLAVPQDELTEVGAEIAGWRQTRICLSIIAPANLIVITQLHHLAEAEPLFDRIRAQWPRVQVPDQRVVLRRVKSWGRLLDRDDRAIDVVPVDPWATSPDS